MNATQTIDNSPNLDVPATMEQILKVATQLAQQKPTLLRLQRAMRFIPDVLKADLGKVNRYDFCRLIGTPMPIQIFGAEIPLGIDNRTPLPVLIRDLKSKGVCFSYGDWGRQQQIADTKCPDVSQANFMVIRAQYAGSPYDLVSANVREMIAFGLKLVNGFVIENAPKHPSSGGLEILGSGADIEIDHSGRIDLTLQPHSSFWGDVREPVCLVRRKLVAS